MSLPACRPRDGQAYPTINHACALESSVQVPSDDWWAGTTGIMEWFVTCSCTAGAERMAWPRQHGQQAVVGSTLA